MVVSGVEKVPELNQGTIFVSESAVLIGLDGKPLYWHTPDNRSMGYLPDSDLLWDMVIAHRHDLAGLAHTHPGGGIPYPSHEDLTTFAPWEKALGRRLLWWIVTDDYYTQFSWSGPERLDYTLQPSVEIFTQEVAVELLNRSHMERTS